MKKRGEAAPESPDSSGVHQAVVEQERGGLMQYSGRRWDIETMILVGFGVFASAPSNMVRLLTPVWHSSAFIRSCPPDSVHFSEVDGFLAETDSAGDPG